MMTMIYDMIITIAISQCHNFQHRIVYHKHQLNQHFFENLGHFKQGLTILNTASIVYHKHHLNQHFLRTFDILDRD